ncbi:MAG: 16S rRNA (cytosine(1402)-N(4))-methyltransferase, partial [Hyphomonadaceae bacterium]|nr:16S rRNA (cytosine(1402)-N(4))-methyltransferase [Clostridia bacterium]
MDFHHVSVLQQQTVDALMVRKNGIYVDGTMGGAGHTAMICEKMGQAATIIGIDQDINAINASQKRLVNYQSQCKLVHDNFKNITNILEKLAIAQIDGAILDLGVSSHQLDEV